MVSEDKLCDTKNRPSIDLTWSLVLFSVLVPFAFVFCVFFSYKLRTFESKSKHVKAANFNPLRTRVEAYNALALTFVVVGCYVILLDPIRQRSHGLSIAMCSTLSWMTWFLPSATYLTLQNVLLQRLKTAFGDTAFEVSTNVTKIWDFFHMCCLLIIAVLLTIRSVFQVDCYIEREISGAVMNRTVLWCSVKHSDYVQDLVVFSAVLVIVGGNLLLAWMYIWRLKAAFFPDALRRRASDGHSSDMDALAVIRKATVVAMASIVTSFLGFIGTALNMYLITYVDVILNVIFLFSMFQFGNGLYTCLFERCHFVSDCCMPEDALKMEKHMKKEKQMKKIKSQQILVDASGNSALPLGPRVLGGSRPKTATLVGNKDARNADSIKDLDL